MKKINGDEEETVIAGCPTIVKTYKNDELDLKDYLIYYSEGCYTLTISIKKDDKNYQKHLEITNSIKESLEFY